MGAHAPSKMPSVPTFIAQRSWATKNCLNVKPLRGSANFDWDILDNLAGKKLLSLRLCTIPENRPRSLQRQTLAEVIEPRYTELLNLVNEEILQLQEQLRQQGVKHHLAAGIVLTGGAAQIEGLAACAQRVFHTQVRIGAPLNITGLTDYAQEPYYSTAVGLLHYGKESHLSGEAEVEKRVTVGSWIKRLNSWLRKEF